jgi:hypothetical protein
MLTLMRKSLHRKRVLNYLLTEIWVTQNHSVCNSNCPHPINPQQPRIPDSVIAHLVRPEVGASGVAKK